MHSTSEFYRILGLSANCSVDEIKHAYREKAKQLHPDRNRSPYAHEEFVLLNEAYQYLVDLKSGKISANTLTDEQQKQAAREQARAHARAYARMRYDEFVNSDHYKSLSSISTVADYIVSFLCILIILFIPSVIIYNYGAQGIFITLFIALLTMPLIVHSLRYSKKVNFSEFFSSAGYIMRTKAFLVLVLSAINLFIIVRIGFRTLITLNLLFSGFVLSGLITFGIIKLLGEKKARFRTYLIACCIVPLFLNGLLLVNFAFAHSTRTESWHFESEDRSTLIALDEDMYREFEGIRLFFDYDDIRGNNTITYTFEKGLLGPEVMTSFHFENKAY